MSHSGVASRTVERMTSDMKTVIEPNIPAKRSPVRIVTRAPSGATTANVSGRAMINHPTVASARPAPSFSICGTIMNAPM